MKVFGLDGREYAWNLAKHTVSASDTRSRSSLHLRARSLLREMFTCDVILEEVVMPGTRLIGDFYINSQRLMVEVQGEQHYKFSSFYFASKAKFRESLKRDKMKKEWCSLNNIVLVELPFNKTDSEWKDIIHAR